MSNQPNYWRSEDEPWESDAPVNGAAGVIRPYTDAMGREQLAVDGPKGTFLVTCDGHLKPFSVWRSDGSGVTLRFPRQDRALGEALRLSGVEL